MMGWEHLTNDTTTRTINKMQKMILNQKISTTVLVLTVLALPVVVYGASLIPCGQPAGTPAIIVGISPHVTTNPCQFNDLFILANLIIHFLLYDVAVPLAALGFMYAGGRLVIFQDKEGEWTKAKGIFEDIALGFGIILGAYVLIKTVLLAFLTTEQVTFMSFMFQ